jgi:DNA modification methylase
MRQARREPAMSVIAETILEPMPLSSLKLEHWPPERLVGYARNPRKNDAVVDRMAEAIREFGFRIPIVAKSDGSVVDGHLRLKAAQALGLDSVPVVLADDLSEAEIKAFRLLANRSATWAEWDDDLLALELSDLMEANFDLSLTGFESPEIDELLSLLNPAADTAEGEDEIPEPPKDPVTRGGDIWLLGEHRLLCGDATVLADVERVLGGALADMAWTDPPYNVDYGNTAKDKRRRKDRRNLNDDLGDRFEAFLTAACTNLVAVTKGAIYIAMSSSELHTLQWAFAAAGGRWSTFLIWAKHAFTLGRADYQRQYEPILYGWRDGAEHYWCGARDQGDVWFFDKPAKNELHPTMKPVALVERAIRNPSKSRDIVLDPFGGSGSTLIAAEKTGRQARLVELDPAYCDVIVQRWQRFSGRSATLEGDGRGYDEIAATRATSEPAPGLR